MKVVIMFLIALLVWACSATQVATTGPQGGVVAQEASPASGPDGLKVEMPTNSTGVTESQLFTSTQAVGAIMNYLASDDLKGRDSGSKGIEKAAQFIEAHFQRYGIVPYYDSFRDTLTNFSKPAYNIVGLVEGNDPELKKEYIIIGAHYDHIGTIRPENGDYIANGANDNASGTTAVMEIAKYFGTSKSNKRSLIFALFSAEEKGLLGSEHMAKNMKEAGLNLYTMLNFEMIGVPMRTPKFTMYITGYKKSNLAEISNFYAEEQLIGYLPTANQYRLFQRSDNYPFFNEFGVPSHTFCTFDFTNYDFYHKVDDEVAELDLEHMATVINKVVPVLEGIANSPTQDILMN